MHFNYLIITLLFHLTPAISKLEKISDEICSFSKENHKYDLSILSRRDFWTYYESYPEGSHIHKQSYFISICHPIRNFKNCEDSNVCFSNFTDKNNTTFVNGGRASSENSVPQFLDEGHLFFDFTNGAPCTGGKNESFTTQLYLQCPLKSETDSFGPILMSNSSCSHTFAWITKAACPKKHLIEKQSCIINVSNNMAINLNSLKSPTFYSVKNSNISFEINICGPIINGSCSGDNVSICDITDINKPKAIAFSHYIKLNWNTDSKHIDMLYNEKNITTNIILECDREKINPEITFKISPGNYKFIVKTVLACLTIESNCVLYHINKSFVDLRPLRHNESNWDIYVPMSLKKIMEFKHYQLNICGPLNNRENIGCSGGPVGACISSIGNVANINLGYVTSNPVIEENGTISVVYTGGDACKKGGPSSSTKIILYCSKTQHMPVLVTVTSSCLHIFEWHTPSACPMEAIVGENCKVMDYVHGEIFDLNPLRKLDNDYIIKSAQNNFLINVCGPLLSNCNGRNSSVCKIGSRKTEILAIGNEKMSVGASPGSLKFDDGTLIMEFNNGSSCKNGSWSTKILIICNHIDMRSNPEYFLTNEEACTHVFIWHTIHACPSFTSVDCFVQDKNNLYDLTELSDPMDNWEFESNMNGQSKKYVFNICRSVIHSKDHRCPYKAGACLLDSVYGSRARSLGNVVTSPYIKNNTLMIHYTGGDLCTNLKRYETLIIFECTPWTYDTVPILMKDDDCQTVIKISTSYACPLKLFAEINPAANCSTRNPFTNYFYDLSILQATKSFKISYGKNVTVFLNVCRHTEVPECSPSGSGSCWVENNQNEPKIMNMGKANSNLQFANWNVFLEYKNGDYCNSSLYGKIQRSTKISFVCSENKDISGPVIVDYDKESCVLYVNWHTHLVCEKKINCYGKGHDDKIFDLAPFAKYFGNYKVTNPSNANKTYYINICKPLNPMEGIRCHPGSAACVVDKSNSTALSLGHALIDPVVFPNNNVVLMYSHGASCPIDGLSSSTLTSRISFICNRTVGVGVPVFVKQTHDCQVQFEWQTSIICLKDSTEKPRFDHCQIYFEKAKANTDLMPLFKKGGYTVKHYKTFKVNVCGAVCNNSGVCADDGTSYGRINNVKLNWESDMLKLTYYTGDPCNKSLSTHMTSTIYFQCDMSAGYGNPVAESWNNAESCEMIFSWRTNVTCIEAIYKQPFLQPSNTSWVDIATTAVGPPSDTQSSGNVGVYIMISLFVGTLVVVVIIVVYFRSIQGRRMTTQAKGFFRRKGDEVFILDDQHLEII